jgi:hypothetical protein
MECKSLRYRKLRIAWSMGCGIVCLLLIVLWVRSSWCREFVYRVSALKASGVVIDYGMVRFDHLEWTPSIADGDGPLGSPGWHRKTTYYSPQLADLLKHLLPGFVFTKNLVTIPIWFLLLLFSTLAIAPWIRRFSLRTLLIGTTLVAVVLGILAISD